MRFFALSFFLLSAGYTFGQQGNLFGVVSDGITNETLIQATVIIKPVNGGAQQGVLSDINGKYTAKLPYGDYDVSVSYVGYQAASKKITIDRAAFELNFALKTVLLNEVVVTADMAIERETPVAFSNIKPLQIEEELGSQPIPMILNSTPGVYATQEGSDDNGPSISIRGFKQRNVSVMIDGIPVNDMENGSVFWNNWFGLDLVTQTMQVQRGLGASKLALPAIGGTVNVITQGIEAKRKTTVKQEYGTPGMIRTTVGHTSGRLDGGWGYTLAASYKYDQGFVDQMYSKAWFYYAKVQKELGNHMLSFSAMGAPSENATRSYQQRIGTYDKDLARSLFKGTEDEYQRLQAYHNAYFQIDNDDVLGNNLTIAQENAAIADLNAQYGYESKADFEAEMSRHDYIDTTYALEKGLKYNVHWGNLNGGIKNERVNKYHKPLFSFRHSWKVSDRLFISNILYSSYGNGGGTSLNPALGGGDYDSNGQVNFQKFYDAHTIPAPPFNTLPIDPTYSATEVKAGWILRRGLNNHQWYGLLSTFQFDYNKNWTFSGGLDARTYRGEHYAEITDLLGADYYIDAFAAPGNEARLNRVGDKISYHNDAFVKWGGLFGMAEFKNQLWNAFLNVSAVYQGYNRIDYFADLNEDGSYAESGWKWIPGFTVKTGGNYKINEYNSAFVNFGYLNRTPVFRNVIGGDNAFVQNTANELITSGEFGYGYSHFPFTLNINGYYTDWNNRPLDNLLRVVIEDADGVERTLNANVNSMNAVHMGIEADGAYQLNDFFTVEGYISFGEWRWNSSSDSLTLIDQETQRPFTDVNGDVVFVSYNAKGVHVGDSPQSQYSASLKFEWKKFYIKPRFTYFDRHYADFDPFSLFGENEQRESWRMPGYGILEMHGGYSFKIKDTQFDLRGSIFNVLNTTYLINAQNNDALTAYVYENTALRYPFSQRNFDAASASVYPGLGFRTNFSLRVRF